MIGITFCILGLVMLQFFIDFALLALSASYNLRSKNLQVLRFCICGFVKGNERHQVWLPMCRHILSSIRNATCLTIVFFNFKTKGGGTIVTVCKNSISVQATRHIDTLKVRQNGKVPLGLPNAILICKRRKCRGESVAAQIFPVQMSLHAGRSAVQSACPKPGRKRSVRGYGKTIGAELKIFSVQCLLCASNMLRDRRTALASKRRIACNIGSARSSTLIKIHRKTDIKVLCVLRLMFYFAIIN